MLNRPEFFLAANKSIAAIADLKGKRVGSNQPRRMAGMVMLVLLCRRQFCSQRDLTLVEGGVNDRTFEALERGDIVAALLPPEKLRFSSLIGNKSVMNR